jgi:hypothetical protein
MGGNRISPHPPCKISTVQSSGLVKAYKEALHVNMELLMSREGDIDMRAPLEGNVAYVDEVPAE